MTLTAEQTLLSFSQDALLYFAANTVAQAGENLHARDEAIAQVGRKLSFIQAGFIREEYIKRIAKELKLKPKDLKEKTDAAIADHKKEQGNKDVSDGKTAFSIPDGADKEDVFNFGFYWLIDGRETGYHFQQGQDYFKQVSNFVIEPLFHSYADENNRIIRINNGVDAPVVVEMPSAAMISNELFSKFVFDQGPFLWWGDGSHLKKLNLKYLRDFPKAFPLNTLGWQREGFFAFFNFAYNGELIQYNEVGLVKHADKYYFSPASSDIYKDYRQENDQFENDRFLQYCKTDVTFSEWSNLLCDVYGDHAWAGIPSIFVALFRDIVFRIDNNCPHLYCYGPTQTGKSKFAQSVMAVFFNDMPMFQLNSGTDYAFSAYMERFRNCLIGLNEFDDKVVKEEWFQQIKGAFDGEGRMRGKGGSKKKTETQKINSMLALVGQWLSTKDDNSIVNRSIVRVFKTITKRTDEQLRSYENLKHYEKQGLSGMLIQLLQYREQLEKEYYQLFHETFSKMIKIMDGRKRKYIDRVLRNYCAMATMVNFFHDKVKLPFSKEEYIQWVCQEVIELTGMLDSSDALSDFWETLQGIWDQERYKLSLEDSLLKVEEFKKTARITEEGHDRTVEFAVSKRLLYIRLTQAQQLYAQKKKAMGGNAMDKVSLQTYIKNRNYYIGRVDSEDIGGNKYSCFILDYDILNQQGFVLEKKSLPGIPDYETRTSSKAAETEKKEKAPYGTQTSIPDDDVPF